MGAVVVVVLEVVVVLSTVKKQENGYLLMESWFEKVDNRSLAVVMEVIFPIVEKKINEIGMLLDNMNPRANNMVVVVDGEVWPMVHSWMKVPFDR
ncbi:hypothetical protein RIF29_03928 [Crotalaria pallida]|uniref:Uncharacterized protein n=1 Tax=Crotalaria pallida TaxID=3830 RepID=A0AAN9J1I1_CROPI